MVIVNDNKIPIIHIDNSTYSIRSKDIYLKNILHVPKVKKNQLSNNKLCQDISINILFDNSNVIVKDRRTIKELLNGDVKNGINQIKLDKKQLPMVNL